MKTYARRQTTSSPYCSHVRTQRSIRSLLLYYYDMCAPLEPQTKASRAASFSSILRAKKNTQTTCLPHPRPHSTTKSSSFTCKSFRSVAIPTPPDPFSPHPHPPRVTNATAAQVENKRNHATGILGELMVGTGVMSNRRITDALMWPADSPASSYCSACVPASMKVSGKTIGRILRLPC